MFELVASKTIKWFSYIRTTPILVPGALYSRIKGFLKLKMAKMRVEVIDSFNS
jgi:hypothetical protein